MDAVIIKFIVTCAIAFAAVVAVAVLCNKWDKRLGSWDDNIKDIEL